MQPATEWRAGHVAGFVVAEGTFRALHTTYSRFAFAVSLGATDAGSCEALQGHFRVGHVYRSPRRQPHHDDEVTFEVQSLSELVQVIVPFMDEHLPPSHKREQYEGWRAELLEYWEHGARRRRACTVEGCETLQRAKGLCRHHYHRRFRR